MEFDIVDLKIQRAEKHINETQFFLDAVLKNEKPYQVAVKNDAHKGESVLFVSKARPLPPDLPLMIGDAVSNLRSALDYLACELVSAKESIGRDTAFPISKDIPSTTGQKAIYDRQVNGMREDAKDLIKQMEPYHGRDNNLWTLHKLNNINKHRALITLAYGAVIISPGGHWDAHVALKEGAELLRLPLDFPDKDKIMLVPTIAFDEPEAEVINHPILTVLRGCMRDVQRVATVLRPYRRGHSHLSGELVIHSA